MMGAADPTPVADIAIASDEADRKSLLSMEYPYSFRKFRHPEARWTYEAMRAATARKKLRKRATMIPYGVLPELLRN
jgi:hypothetical protein